MDFSYLDKISRLILSKARAVNSKTLDTEFRVLHVYVRSASLRFVSSQENIFVTAGLVFRIYH